MKKILVPAIPGLLISLNLYAQLPENFPSITADIHYPDSLAEDFTIVAESLQLNNGYVGEAHDFQILNNRNALCFGFYPETFDLRERGGQPNARVRRSCCPGTEKWQYSLL